MADDKKNLTSELNALDTIYRQAAIEEVKKLFEMGDCYCDRASIVGMLNSMPSAQPEPQWIPCSERLPEERQEILATTTDNAWGDVVIIRTYYKEMHKSVIAWMPLPEPFVYERNEKSL